MKPQTRKANKSAMPVHVDMQIAVDQPLDLPAADEFTQWAQQALAGSVAEAELTIRIVDEDESAQLNRQYRHKQGATNVLSFPFATDVPLPVTLLGDLVICAAVVEREAQQQCKDRRAHWAHMVVHGCLHLLGYDHIEEQQAQQMEALEVEYLALLGFSNPYEVNDTHE